MDRLRTMLAGVQKQLGHLSVTQKLLIGTLCVIVLMTMFLLSQYAGTPTTVALLPSSPGEDQQRAAAFLARKGMDYKIGADGKVMMPQEQRYIALAAMQREQAIPGDKKLLFNDLVTATSWIEDLQTKQVRKTIALQNELARIIRAMGFEDAGVFIAAPQDAGGIGASAKKPVAQVAVFPSAGQGVDQGTVNALADLVAGSVVGLDVRDVAVVDGRNKRSYRAVAGDDLVLGGGSYIEQVTKVEKRLQDKLAEHLRFIPDAIVSVNAIVDAAKRDRHTTAVLPKGKGSLSMATQESTTTDSTTTSGKGGIEPGIAANAGMDLNRGGGGGNGAGNTSKETSTTTNAVQFGMEETTERQATGRPTKINVTVSVPREYVAAIWKQGAAAPAAGGAGGSTGGAPVAEPTDKDIADTFDKSVKAQIEGMISPLVETEGAGVGTALAGGATQLVAGTVRAFLIPISMAGMGGGAAMGGGKGGLFGGGGGMGGTGGMSAILESGLVKTAALGLLAVVALGMMFTMVRKASKAMPLPTAEELVGIPPALEPGTEVVGEAIEGDTAMAGIEIDERSLKSSKMLEEIGALVKNNPQTAASVFSRWLSESE